MAESRTVTVELRVRTDAPVRVLRRGKSYDLILHGRGPGSSHYARVTGAKVL